MSASAQPLEEVDLSEEQLAWVGERMPSAGRLTTAEDAVEAYRLRRAHTSYRTLQALFACSRSSLRRAIVLVSAQRGDDPAAWQQERRERRRRLVAGFYVHREQVRARQATIGAEIKQLRAEQRVVLPLALATPEPAPAPRDARAEQERVLALQEPARPARPMHGTAARAAVNLFARQAGTPLHARPRR